MASIHRRVMTAIVEHRLPPGTRLGEERLARAFGVSRTLIRQVIERLSHEGVVTVQSRRGAVVASPSIEQAREVFAARRLIEPDLVRRAISRATPADVQRLRAHAALEAGAREARDRRALVRLSGEFHQLIADMAGNRYLAKVLRELEVLTSLVILLYDGPHMSACPHHEHEALVDAIEAGDAARAVSLMAEHLDHVERSLDFGGQPGHEVDFDAIFAP